MNDPLTFNRSNTVSEVLSKIRGGAADIDFAREMAATIDRCKVTEKSGKVIVTVEIVPDEERGCFLMRAEVTSKMPRLPPPASQMHYADDGRLLSQQEFIMGGGPSESRPKPLPDTPASASGRHQAIGKVPGPAPIAPAPAPAPLTGKDAAAGND